MFTFPACICSLDGQLHPDCSNHDRLSSADAHTVCFQGRSTPMERHGPFRRLLSPVDCQWQITTIFCQGHECEGAWALDHRHLAAHLQNGRWLRLQEDRDEAAPTCDAGGCAPRTKKDSLEAGEPSEF